MKIRTLLFMITALLLTGFYFISCGNFGNEPEDPVTHQVEYYMTNDGSWAGTSNKYIEENTLAPKQTIADISTSNILEDFQYIYQSVEWFADENHTTPFDFTQEIVEPITIYGKLKEKDTYTIQFYVGDEPFATTEVTNGEAPIYPDPLPSTEPGFEVFWSYEKDEWFQFLSNKVTRDLVLYAFFF